MLAVSFGLTNIIRFNDTPTGLLLGDWGNVPTWAVLVSIVATGAVLVPIVTRRQVESPAASAPARVPVPASG